MLKQREVPISSEGRQPKQKAETLNEIASLITFPRITEAAQLTKRARKELGLTDAEIADAFAKGVGRVIAATFLLNPKKGLKQANWWIPEVTKKFYGEADLPKTVGNLKEMAITRGLIHAILRLVDSIDPTTLAQTCEGQVKARICDALRVDPKDYPSEQTKVVPIPLTLRR